MKNCNQSELTRKEVEEYLIVQGYSLGDDNIPIKECVDWYLDEPSHRSQIIEAVRNNYDVCDFDRWMKIQKIIFSNEVDEFSFADAMDITRILESVDKEVLDLHDYTDNSRALESNRDSKDDVIRITEHISTLYRIYDLKPSNHQVQIEKLVSLLMKEIAMHPCLKLMLENVEQMKHFIVQMALENI